MNKDLMLNKIKKYLADKYECDISELDKKGLNIIKNNDENKLKMLLLYDLILVSSSNNIYDLVNEKLKNKNTYEIFEFPLVYGQSIYYIPDLDRITKQDEIDNLTRKKLDKALRIKDKLKMYEAVDAIKEEVVNKYEEENIDLDGEDLTKLITAVKLCLEKIE